MATMNRRAPLLVAPLVALAACTSPAQLSPAPSAASGPAVTAGPATAEAASPRATPAGTPDPLPTIPPNLPNEIIRTTFESDAVGNEVATHQFMGQVVSVHLLCASHEGSVDVALMVDGVERISFSNDCTTPAFTVEDASFTAGRHEVVFQVEPSGGAQGVVYLLEGDI